ncbi:MAG: hypothetical protein II997_01715 [Clostridia bacterium]|nr:hypothetical protein [Clostridia bacterium]
MKKIISICLCALLFVTCLPNVAMAAESFNAKLSSEEIALFEATGILAKKDPFVTTENMDITHAEFARVLVRMLGYENIPSDMVEMKETYRDVNSGTTYAAEILLATELGLFGNNISAYFHPEDKVQTQWAAKAIARLLGYGQRLERNINVLATLGILEGLSSNGTFLRRDDALKMMYNALDVQVMQVIGLAEGGVLTEANQYETILTEYFGIYNRESVLLADSMTSVYGEKPREGYVRFEDGLFLHKNLETKHLVGSNVRYYYEYVDDEPVIVHFEKRRNTEYVFSADEVVYDYANNQYTADKNGKTVKFPMELTTMVSYNGKPSFDKNLMEPSTGQVALIDNDRDGYYEVVIIREFTNILVKGRNVGSGIIYDLLDAGRNINVDSYEDFTLFSEGNEKIELEELKADTVLTLYESADGTSAEAYVSGKTMTMLLEQVDSGSNQVTIEGNLYDLSDDYRLPLSTLTVGQRYVFYLNHWNEVVYLAANWDMDLFYLLDAKKETSGLNSGIYIKGLESTDEIFIYELADYVVWYTYDNSPQRLKKDAAYDLLAPADVTNRQMMKLGRNEAGQVTEILIAYEADTRAKFENMHSDYPLIYQSHYNTLSQWPNGGLSSATITYKSSTGLFNNWMDIAGLRIFKVPTVNGASYSDDDVHTWQWTLRGSGDFTADVTKLKFYSETKNKLGVPLMVLDVADNSVNNFSWPNADGYGFTRYLVADIIQAVDEDTKEVETVLKLVSGSGSISQLSLEKDELIESATLIAQANAMNEKHLGIQAELPAGKTRVEPGDMVGIATKNGKITALHVYYDGELGQDINTRTDSYSAGLFDTVTCEIVKTDGSVFECKVIGGDGFPDASGNDLIRIKPSGSVVEFNFRNHNIKKLTSAEIFPGDKVMMHFRWGVGQGFVIYKSE